jgi:hypothetical protein
MGEGRQYTNGLMNLIEANFGLRGHSSIDGSPHIRAALELRTRSPLPRDAFSRGNTPLQTLLSRFARLAVIGQRGSGRTTFLRLAAHQRCKARLASPADDDLAVPVLVERPASAGSGSLAALLAEPLRPHIDYIRDAAEDGRALFLIDGSETPGGSVAVDSTCSLVHRFPRSRFVVGLDREAARGLRSLDFRIADIEPVEVPQARAYIRARAKRLASAYSETAASGLWSLYLSLDEEPSVRELVRNPQTLAWLCRQSERRGQAPRTLLALAEASIDSLLAETDEARGDAGAGARRALERAAFERQVRAVSAVEPREHAGPAWLEDERLRGALAAHEGARLLEHSPTLPPTSVRALAELARSDEGALCLAELLLGQGDAQLARLIDCLGRLADETESLTDALALAAAAANLVHGAAQLGAALETRPAPAIALLARASVSPRLHAAARIEAGEALGRLGDPRVGEDPLSSLVAPGPHAGFELGRYPVVVSHFERFVDSGGYDDRSVWSELGWHEKSSLGLTAPADFEHQRAHPNRPVVGVCAYEADAFCRWLGRERDALVRLPTLHQWSAGATHPEGPYPWGSDDPDSERLNFEQEVGRPTPVGVYPAGFGPSGHADMVGNTWEWTADHRESGRIVVAGGWFSKGKYCRSDYSYHFDPRNRFHDLGFRIVAIPKPEAP